MTNAEARFSNSLRSQKPEGSLGRPAQDGHLDSHTAPELCHALLIFTSIYSVPPEPLSAAFCCAATDDVPAIIAGTRTLKVKVATAEFILFSKGDIWLIQGRQNTILIKVGDSSPK